MATELGLVNQLYVIMLPYAHPLDQDTMILDEQTTPQQQSLPQGVEPQQSTGGMSHEARLPPTFTYEELNWIPSPVTQELSYGSDEEILVEPTVTHNSASLWEGAPHDKVLDTTVTFKGNFYVAHTHMVTERNKEVIGCTDRPFPIQDAALLSHYIR